MKVTDFSAEVSKEEGKAKQLSIAEIKEVLKVTNKLLNGELYKLIKKL